jgi:hypothetical protein
VAVANVLLGELEVATEQKNVSHAQHACNPPKNIPTTGFSRQVKLLWGLMVRPGYLEASLLDSPLDRLCDSCWLLLQRVLLVDQVKELGGEADRDPVA